MSLKFYPAPGTLLLCDYGLGGFIVPEMVKRRPAVVVSPRLPHRETLCAVVPLSTTAPERPTAYAVEINMPHLLPAPFDAPICWAKCDMIATVSVERLDLFRTGRDHTGKRQYLTARLPAADMERIRIGILAGLGFIDG